MLNVTTCKLLHIIILCTACNRTHFPLALSQAIRGLCQILGELRPLPRSYSLVTILCEKEMETVQKLIHTSDYMKKKHRQIHFEAARPLYEVISEHLSLVLCAHFPQRHKQGKTSVISSRDLSC